jgi:hypothetical protein
MRIRISSHSVRSEVITGAEGDLLWNEEEKKEKEM